MRAFRVPLFHGVLPGLYAVGLSLRGVYVKPDGRGVRCLYKHLVEQKRPRPMFRNAAVVGNACPHGHEAMMSCMGTPGDWCWPALSRVSAGQRGGP